MSELLVVVVVLCHSRVLGLSSSIILRTNNGSHPVLKHTKDPALLLLGFSLPQPLQVSSAVHTGMSSAAGC